MCGIVGWFSSRPVAAESAGRLQAMVDSLAHRGPDGQGALLTGNAALGHTRLAIIDPDGGAQPMSNESGTVHIVFNGEIYNFGAIREALIRDGIGFHTHSDTEVILKLYEHHGWESFARLRGMYAFAIWDGRSRTAWLARDPNGIKPLFVQRTEKNELTFASEAKAILADDPTRARLDEDSLHLLLNFRYLPGTRSLFRGITQLAPGEVVSWRPDGTEKSYRIGLSPELDSNEEILNEVASSVRAHLVADVEVGAYLSGGIDSATIVALAKRDGFNRIRTFTLEVGDDPNEARNAARTAQLLDVENVHEAPLQSAQDALPQMVWHLEIPKVNGLQVYQLARMAAKHVKVALSGLGGDELFLGYNAHRILHLARRTDRLLPAWATRTAGRAASAFVRRLCAPVWTEPERALLMLEALGTWDRVYGLLRNVWDSGELRRIIYGPRLLDAQLTDAFSALAQGWPRASDPVAAMAEFEWNQKMVNDLLWQEDRLSMAVGLEVRVPFVDSVLKNRLAKLSPAALMRNGRPKAFMRDMLRSVLPQEILKRPKSGFQVDAPIFFTNYLAPLADELLSDSRVREAGLFNPSFVKRLRTYPPRTRFRWHYFLLYLMLGAHLWLDIFEKRSWRSRH
jgi:asparagine synthase (glutamine-hydrolysing)